MKRIKYKYMYAEINHGTKENPKIEQVFINKDIPYTEESLTYAQKEAYNGEYIIEDDGRLDSSETPTELETLDARLTYVEMMMGLMEV